MNTGSVSVRSCLSLFVDADVFVQSWISEPLRVKFKRMY